MKIYKLFPFALAAMAFASCSNEDEKGQNPNAKSEIVDVMTVSFTNNGTYATGDEAPGVGTENDIYHAFVFARESAPGHLDPQLGDYTVVEVGKLDATEAIKPGDKETGSTLANMANFKGVTVGEEVFVIANDPKLTLDDAKKMSRHGLSSAATIKAYKMAVDKSYLGALATAKGTNPAGKKFVMTGSGKVPNGKAPEGETITVTCEIGLNREMAKVDFTAQVSTSADAVAKGNVKIGDDDGIIVLRLPRFAAPFADLDIADYISAKPNDADYDWTATWAKAFDGDANSASGTPVEEGTTTGFNITAPNESAKEYRYTWAGKDQKLKIANGILTSPTFYVTPNYAGLNSTKTVVVTQATIVNDMLDAMFTKEVLAVLDPTGAQKAPWLDGEGAATASLKALLAAINTNKDNAVVKPVYEAYKTEADAAGDTGDATKLVTYRKDAKTYYAADIALYTGDKSDNITKRNHFYQMTGTITTMGASTIKDASSEKNVDMIVKVKVNPWTVVVNKINM